MVKPIAMPRNIFLIVVAGGIGVILLGSAAFSTTKNTTIRPNATVTCASSSPCETYSNTSTGSGTRSTSVNGNAISGTSTNLNGIVGVETAVYPKPTPTGIFFGRSGVVGQDKSTDFLEQGVLGTSINGIGVWGTTVNNWAILGYTTSPGTSAAIAGVGVFGLEQSTTPSNFNVGTTGWAASGTGLMGRTRNESTIAANGQLGVFGLDSATTSTNNAAVGGLSKLGAGGFFQSSSGAGVIAVSASGTGLAVQAQGTTTAQSVLNLYSKNGAPLIYANGPTKPAMSLDASGNMILAGMLTQNGTPLVVQRASTGGSRIAYSPMMAQATIEDVGEAMLVNGFANVRLEPTFASTMDLNKGYVVFLQPEGMVQGNLCVVSRTAAGFSVHESGAGHSSVAFAYRIIGHPFGSTEQRLPLANLPQTAQRKLMPDWTSRVNAFLLRAQMLARSRPGLQ